MRLRNIVILFVTLLFLSCSKSYASSIVINRCCEPYHIYDAVQEKCLPRRADIDRQSSSKTITGHPTAAAWHSLSLPVSFVKILDGRKDSKSLEITFQHHQPTSTCTKGAFQKSFCFSEDEKDCAGGTERLQLTTRGELRVGNEYYAVPEYCTTRIYEKGIEFRICNPTCTDEVPCVRKCCDIDQVRDVDDIWDVLCVPYDGVAAWEPHFYSNVKSHVKSQSPVRPHYFVSNPTEWCTVPENNLTLEQRDESTGKLNWLFRVGTRRNIFYRTTRYSWKEKRDTWNYSCVDGAVNTGPLPQDNLEIFQGIEEEDVLFECLPGSAPSRLRSTGQLVLYGLVRITSCIFLLATLVVYGLLWKRQKVHGWTLMSYCFSQLVTFMFYVGKYYHSATAVNTGQVETLCVVIGVVINYFFISTFCWMTMINFDLWWKFRSLKVMSSSSRGVQRFVAYAVVSLGTPTAFVATALALDYTYGKDPESGVIVPEYGKKTCGPEPDTAQWVFQFGPAGVFWLFNLFFFASTLYSIFKHQEDSRSARSSSSSMSKVDATARAKLFGKLLIVMGIPFAFEFISTLDEGTKYGDASWYWVVFDMINYLQGVYIFFIFVFKKDTRKQLAEQYSFFERFGQKTSFLPESKPLMEATSSTTLSESSSYGTKF